MSKSIPQFSFAIIADTHFNPQNTPNTSPWPTNRLANDRTRVVVAPSLSCPDRIIRDNYRIRSWEFMYPCRRI
jgi:hypothetical protein